MRQEIYTIEQYIEFRNEIYPIPVGFFAEKKERDEAMNKYFFFNNEGKLPSIESVQKYRWGKKGEM